MHLVGIVVEFQCLPLVVYAKNFSDTNSSHSCDLGVKPVMLWGSLGAGLALGLIARNGPGVDWSVSMRIACHCWCARIVHQGMCYITNTQKIILSYDMYTKKAVAMLPYIQHL